jgi:hypothetical protein
MEEVYSCQFSVVRKSDAETQSPRLKNTKPAPEWRGLCGGELL